MKVIKESIDFNSKLEYNYDNISIKYHKTTNKGTRIYKVYYDHNDIILGYKLSIYSNVSLQYPYKEDIDNPNSIIEFKCCPWNISVLDSSAVLLGKYTMKEYFEEKDRINDEILKSLKKEFMKYLGNFTYKDVEEDN